MLCFWWYQQGVLYYELPNLDENINGEHLGQQLIKFKRAIAKKRPAFATIREAIIFFLNNARLSVARPVKNNLEISGWEVLSHPSYPF